MVVFLAHDCAHTFSAAGNMREPRAITYIANVRLPTQKAHGIAIMRACQAFARADALVRLVVARRLDTLPKDAHAFYDIPEHFPIIRLPIIDFVRVRWISGGVAFFIKTFTFYCSLFVWALFQSRQETLYTRDAPVLLLRFFGYQTVYECHAISRQRRLFFFLLRRATKIVVISSALKQTLVAGGIDGDRILIAPSGVDLSIFDISVSQEDARRLLHLPLEGHIALYTGNFTTMGEDKGLNDCIRALSFAPEMLFVAVGGADNDIAHYAALAREESVRQRVTLLPYASQKSLALYQKAADMLVMPFPDTPHYRHHMSPVKMFEYLAAERPIIASDLPTIREVLSERTAFFIPPGDPRALASMMEYVMKEKDEASARAHAAHETATQYSWDARAQKVLHFLRQ